MEGAGLAALAFLALVVLLPLLCCWMKRAADLHRAKRKKEEEEEVGHENLRDCTIEYVQYSMSRIRRFCASF